MSNSPFLEPRHFLTVFLLLNVSIIWHKLHWVGFNAIFGWFAVLAPISYALYIVHYPIVYYASEKQLMGNVWLDLLWIVPVVLGLSWVIEQPLQKRINSWIR